MSTFLGKGWRFPIKPNGRGGLDWSSGERSISESIWTILSTPRRSRIMSPGFGCGMHDYLFSPNNATTRAMIATDVRNALVKWEPRIDVLKVNATTRADNPNMLMVEVDYRIRTNNANSNIVYPFYLNEGGS